SQGGVDAGPGGAFVGERVEARAVDAAPEVDGQFGDVDARAVSGERFARRQIDVDVVVLQVFAITGVVEQVDVVCPVNSQIQIRGGGGHFLRVLVLLRSEVWDWTALQIEGRQPAGGFENEYRTRMCHRHRNWRLQQTHQFA